MPRPRGPRPLTEEEKAAIRRELGIPGPSRSQEVPQLAPASSPGAPPPSGAAPLAPRGAAPPIPSRPSGKRSFDIREALTPFDPGYDISPDHPLFTGGPGREVRNIPAERLRDLITSAEKGTFLSRTPELQGIETFLDALNLSTILGEYFGEQIERDPGKTNRYDFLRSIERFNERPISEQIVLGGLAEPSNIIPGVGFAPLGRGAARPAVRAGQEGIEALATPLRVSGPASLWPRPIAPTPRPQLALSSPASRPQLALPAPTPESMRPRVSPIPMGGTVPERAAATSGDRLRQSVSEIDSLTSEEVASELAGRNFGGRQGTKDDLYRSLLSTSGRRRLAPGETWRDRALRTAENMDPPVEKSPEVQSFRQAFSRGREIPRDLPFEAMTPESASALRAQVREAVETYGMPSPARPATESVGPQGVSSGANVAADTSLVKPILMDGLPPPTGPASIIPPDAPSVVSSVAEQPSSSGMRYVGSLRDDIDGIADEVVTSDNPVLRGLIGRTGINPSILKDTPSGRLIVAYSRQNIAAEELVKTTLAASLDTHAQSVTGRLPLKISPEGLWGDTGVPWQDVFSRPQNYSLDAAQKSYIDDFLAVIREANEYLADVGLPRRTLDKEGWFYVPRQVKNVREVALEAPSSPKLQRYYEEAADGFAKGIRYEADPRATLEIHLRTMYKEIIDKQLSDATTLRSITPRDIASGINPQVIKDYDDAVAEMLPLAKRLRDLRRQMRGLQVGPETGEARRSADALRQARRPRRQNLQDEINALRERLDTLGANKRVAKNRYQRLMESARKSKVVPGRLFGANQPDDIPVTTWRNRFYPKEEGEQLIKGIEELTRTRSQNWVFRTFENVGDFIRFTGAVGDFALPFIQGQPVLASNPRAWGRSLLRHEQAFFNPRVQAKLIKDHLPTYQKMAREGVPIGDPEFFRAIEEGRGFNFGAPVDWIPANTDIGRFARKVRRGARTVGQQTVGRFQASYNTGLGYSRALMWESLEPTWKGSTAELAQHVRNLTGGLDSRALGVGANQRAAESFWLAFSPRLLRSTIGLFADAMRPNTPQGRAALMTLGKWVSGATLLYVLSGMSLGKTWEEIGTGLNPLSGKRFYSHEINGQWYGIGGQIRSILQAMALLTSTLAPGGKPIEGLAEFDYYDNPILQFYTSRGAPALNLVGGAAEAATGGRADFLPHEKVDDLPDLAKHLGKSSYPFAVQAYIKSGKTQEERSIVPGLIEFGAGFRTSRFSDQDLFESNLRKSRAPSDVIGGLTYGLTNPPGEFIDIDRRRNRLARERFGRDYKELPEGLRDIIRRLEQSRRTPEQAQRESFIGRQRQKRRSELERERLESMPGR